MRRSSSRGIDVERRRGGRRRRRARSRRCRRTAPAGSPARRSARGSSGTRRSSRPAADRSASDDAPVQRGERAADGDGQRRRAGDAGAGRRLAARRQRRRSRAGSAAPAAPAAAARRRRRARTSARRRRVRSVSIETQLDAAVGRAARSATCARRLIAAFSVVRAVVKQIERPDVDGAAGQIDARRRGRGDAHARNYSTERL